MKYYFLAALLLVCACSFSQQPVLTDDLNSGTDKILKKYIRFNENGELANSNYAIEPARFYEKINLARKDAYLHIKSGDPEETTLKRLNTDYYLRLVLCEYKLWAHFRTKSNGQKVMTDAQEKKADSLVYSNVDPNNETLFKGSAAYREWMGKYLVNLYQTGDGAEKTFQGISNAVPASIVTTAIQNPFIRDYECYLNANMALKQIKEDSALVKRVYQEFSAAETNSYFMDKIQQLYDNYKRMHTAGAPAPDFTYTAVDGKPVTLSNLRGKYVYIDIWATWCMPCKGEIPYLMKMEEGYKDKNIQFVSLSVDKQASAGTWRKYVTDNKLTGYQVMADKDFHSDFIEKFNIAAIPRFILIDPEGNVVSADAKRPSDAALKKQLNQLLGIPEPPFALSPYARKTDFSGHWRLNKTKTKFGNYKNEFVSITMNVTKSESALLVERTDVNKEKKQSHYSEQFKLDGTATQTTMTGFNRPEVDSLENNPEKPGLTLDRGIQIIPTFNINLTETWRLADGGKTLVVDWAQIVPGMGSVKIKAYYDKQKAQILKAER